MYKNLYEACLTGNVQALNALLQQDQLLLDRASVTCFHETPLHIAALRGHLDFATRVLAQNPRLATWVDSCGRTPLHLASCGGHVEIVRALLRTTGPDACRVRDQDGRTPFRLAAVHGRVDVVNVMIQAKPELAREVGEDGETVLHACIAYGRFDVLKTLCGLWNEEELVKAMDRKGNTLLHLAVLHKQIQTVKYLLQKSSVKASRNVLNGHGFTALDVLDHLPRDFKGLEIQEVLTEAGISRAKDVRPSRSLTNVYTMEKPSRNVTSQSEPKGYMSRMWRWYLDHNGNWLEEQRGILILSTVVVSALAFYSGLHPPGGTFTDPNDGPLGNAVQTEVVTGNFHTFTTQNTIILVVSQIILLLLLSGIPLRNKLCLWVLHLATLCVVFFVMVTYLQEIAWMSPDSWLDPPTLYMGLAWILVCLLFGFVHTVFFVIWVTTKLLKGRKTARNEDVGA